MVQDREAAHIRAIRGAVSGRTSEVKICAKSNMRVQPLRQSLKNKGRAKISFIVNEKFQCFIFFKYVSVLLLYELHRK